GATDVSRTSREPTARTPKARPAINATAMSTTSDRTRRPARCPRRRSRTRATGPTTADNRDSTELWTGTRDAAARAMAIASMLRRGPATASRPAASRRSNALSSVIAELPFESMEEARQARPHSGWAPPCRKGEFGRIEAGQVSHGDQGSIVWVEPGECVAQVDRVDRRPRVEAAPRLVDFDNRDFEERAPPPGTNELASFVHGYGHEPRAQPCRVAKAAELAPGDRPGRCDGVL